MTNLQVLQHLIGSSADVSPERLAITLELLGLDPAATYSSDNKCLIYKAAIQEIQQAKGVKEEAEGGYKIVYADVSIPGILSGLANASGCSELIDMFSGQPKIRNKSYMW